MAKMIEENKGKMNTNSSSHYLGMLGIEEECVIGGSILWAVEAPWGFYPSGGYRGVYMIINLLL